MESQFYQQATIFPLVNLHVSNYFLLLLDETSTLTSAHDLYFSQKYYCYRNESNNLPCLIVFLRVNMFPILLFWFSEASKFFPYGIHLVAKKMTFNLGLDFCNIVLLYIKTFQYEYFKYFFESEGQMFKSLNYHWALSTSQKSLQVLHIFPIFTKLYACQMKKINACEIDFSLICKTKCLQKANSLDFPKIKKFKYFSNQQIACLKSLLRQRMSFNSLIYMLEDLYEILNWLYSFFKKENFSKLFICECSI